jgi:hypothetical protein
LAMSQAVGQLIQCQFAGCHALLCRHIPAMPYGGSSAPYTSAMAYTISACMSLLQTMTLYLCQTLPLDNYAVRNNAA